MRLSSTAGLSPRIIPRPKYNSITDILLKTLKEVFWQSTAVGYNKSSIQLQLLLLISSFIHLCRLSDCVFHFFAISESASAPSNCFRNSVWNGSNYFYNHAYSYSFLQLFNNKWSIFSIRCIRRF